MKKITTFTSAALLAFSAMNAQAQIEPINNQTLSEIKGGGLITLGITAVKIQRQKPMQKISGLIPVLSPVQGPSGSGIVGTVKQASSITKVTKSLSFVMKARRSVNLIKRVVPNSIPNSIPNSMSFRKP